MDRLEKIKNHFSAEAKDFDQIIVTLIPFYESMADALISAVPFDKLQPINVLDIGCGGTGTIAKRIKEQFPCSKITCLDLLENMIKMAKIKLKECDDISYHVGNMAGFEFDKKYDLIISSLAVHHLESNRDKKNFFKKIFDNLSDMGVFYNADIILGSNEYLQEMYMSKWKKFMGNNVSPEEIKNKWIPKYLEEDRPAKLVSQIEWLVDIGFKDVDVIWKYYNFAVYGGIK